MIGMPVKLVPILSSLGIRFTEFVFKFHAINERTCLPSHFLRVAGAVLSWHMVMLNEKDVICSVWPQLTASPSLSAKRKKPVNVTNWGSQGWKHSINFSLKTRKMPDVKTFYELYSIPGKGCIKSIIRSCAWKLQILYCQTFGVFCAMMETSQWSGTGNENFWNWNGKFLSDQTVPFNFRPKCPDVLG